jgi:hypothetical protein
MTASSPTLDPGSGPLGPPASDPLDQIREAVATAPNGQALAREIRHRVEQLNACLSDAASLGLKVELTMAETFLNVVEDLDARTPVWRVRCKIYEELGT